MPLEDYPHGDRRSQNNKKTYEEIQLRIGLIQIFLIISGFFLAYSSEEWRQPFITMFVMCIFFAIFYYVYLTRTKIRWVIDFFGFLSSLSFSLFLLLFIHLRLGGSIFTFEFYLVLFSLTGIFTFAFLSPETSDLIVNWFAKHMNNKKRENE